MMECDPWLEVNDFGLCYPPCKYSTVGAGPICWGKCPNGTKPCAGTLCMSTSQSCEAKVMKIVMDAITQLTLTANSSMPNTMMDLSVIFDQVNYPTCPNF